MQRREFVYRSAWAVAAFGVLRQVGACRAPSAETATSPFVALRDRYFIHTLELNPVVSTYLGGDGYTPVLAEVNGLLRDFRPEALGREAAFYHEVRDALAKIDRSGLGPAERIDASVLEAQVTFLLHQLEDRRYHERSVDTYVAEPFRGIDWQQQQMQTLAGGLLGSEDEWRLVVARLRAVPAYLEAALANLREGKRRGNLPDRRMVQRDGLDAVNRRSVVSGGRKLALVARATAAALRLPSPLRGVPALPAVQYLVDAAVSSAPRAWARVSPVASSTLTSSITTGWPPSTASLGVPITTWVALGWPSMSRLPAPKPLRSMVIGGRGPKPDARAVTSAAPVGVVSSTPRSMPRVGAPTAASSSTTAGAGFGSRPCAVRTMPVPVTITDA